MYQFYLKTIFCLKPIYIFNVVSKALNLLIIKQIIPNSYFKTSSSNQKSQKWRSVASYLCALDAFSHRMVTCMLLGRFVCTDCTYDWRWGKFRAFERTYDSHNMNNLQVKVVVVRSVAIIIICTVKRFRSNKTVFTG